MLTKKGTNKEVDNGATNHVHYMYTEMVCAYKAWLIQCMRD